MPRPLQSYNRCKLPAQLLNMKYDEWMKDYRTETVLSFSFQQSKSCKIFWWLSKFYFDRITERILIVLKLLIWINKHVMLDSYEWKDIDLDRQNCCFFLTLACIFCIYLHSCMWKERYGVRSPSHKKQNVLRE